MKHVLGKQFFLVCHIKAPIYTDRPLKYNKINLSTHVSHYSIIITMWSLYDNRCNDSSQMSFSGEKKKNDTIQVWNDVRQVNNDNLFFD